MVSSWKALWYKVMKNGFRLVKSSCIIVASGELWGIVGKSSFIIVINAFFMWTNKASSALFGIRTCNHRPVAWSPSVRASCEPVAGALPAILAYLKRPWRSAQHSQKAQSKELLSNSAHKVG